MSVLVSGVRVGLMEDQEDRWQRALEKAGIRLLGRMPVSPL